MTSDDTDTQQGDDEGTQTPPRDPETGKFIPEDERPDGTSDSSETEGNQSDETTGQPGDDGSEPMPSAKEPGPEHSAVMEADHSPASAGESADTRETESEPMDEDTDTTAEAHEQEAEPMDGDTETDSSPATADAEPPTGESGAESPAAASDDALAEDTEPAAPAAVHGVSSGTRERPKRRPVFVVNPNGYPRPSAAYLPTHPWLRPPSRAPAYETISR